ncbi:MAG: nucleotide exchange factor GrpE, partial [Oscillospiraceae bacterium]|nr:nucleotide exchange factor GrpE [Oscillospiraceae bacterium]
MARKVKDQNEETPVNPEIEEPAPETAEAPAPEAASPEEDKLSALEAELASEKDKYLRLAAEYDNYRKRSQKEREALYTDVRSETLLKILPVYDNIKRALEQPCEDKAYARGVELIMEQIKDIFSKLGVTEIPALGEQFDPE